MCGTGVGAYHQSALARCTILSAASPLRLPFLILLACLDMSAKQAGWMYSLAEIGFHPRLSCQCRWMNRSESDGMGY